MIRVEAAAASEAQLKLTQDASTLSPSGQTVFWQSSQSATTAKSCVLTTLCVFVCFTIVSFVMRNIMEFVTSVFKRYVTMGGYYNNVIIFYILIR